MSEEFMIVGPERDTAVKHEIERRKGFFITDFLDEKRAKLGLKKFQKQKPKLIKEAEKAWERKQAKKAAREKKEEEKRREKAKKAAEGRRLRRQWTSPTVEFLEKKLFTSKSERNATLRRYDGYTPAIQRVFKLKFYELILRHLDRAEGRKLRD